MSTIKEENNKFNKQIEEIDECQKNAANLGDMGKGHGFRSRLIKYPIVLVILGALGLVFTGISLIGLYKSTTKVSELAKPLMYNFIPFVISFLLFKIGIDELIKRKK